MKKPRMITVFEDRSTTVSLSETEREELLSLESLWGRQNFILRADNSLLLKKYVGFVSTPNLQIQILPKIYHDHDAFHKDGLELDQAIQVLFRLIHASEFLSIKEIPKAQDIATCEHDLLEVFIHIFAKQFLELFSRHIHRTYEIQEENTSKIKGKILFQQNILKNNGLKHRHFVQFDEFSEDNLLNRILKTVMLRLRDRTKSSENKNKLTIGISYLENVQTIQLTEPIFDRVRFNRLNESYRPIFEMAKLFYQKLQPGLRAGDEHTFSFLVPVNELFECAIYKLMLQIYAGTPFQIDYQGPRKYLDVSNSTFLMKPDITVQNQSLFEMIVDAKYKNPLIESKVKLSQPDVYQMLAYAVRYRCNNIFLIYPKFINNGHDENLLSVHTLDIDDRRVKLHAIQLDITQKIESLITDLAEQLDTNGL